MKAVIFDMDGLMIDSERVTYEGYVREFEKRGLTYTVDFYKKQLGMTIPMIYDLNYKEFGQDLDLDTIIDHVHRYMAQRFETEGVPVKEGLKELLQYLKGHGYKTVVATSSARSRVDHILELADIEKYFDASVCGDEVSHGKPDPETFLVACQKVGVDPSEALVLEDSEAGIQAAYAGHIPVICVPDMKYPEPEYADKTWRIVNSLLDVKELLESVHGGVRAGEEHPQQHILT